MSTLTPTSASTAPNGLTGALKTFAKEAFALLDVLLSPGRMLREVDQMRALLVAANAADATDPERAAALRLRASRIGLN